MLIRIWTKITSDRWIAPKNNTDRRICIPLFTPLAIGLNEFLVKKNTTDSKGACEMNPFKWCSSYFNLGITFCPIVYSDDRDSMPVKWHLNVFQKCSCRYFYSKPTSLSRTFFQAFSQKINIGRLEVFFFFSFIRDQV